MPRPPDDDLIFTAWIRGWALTREVAPPVPQADGYRIAVGLPRQAARYVFPQPSPTLRELGASTLYESLGWRVHAPWATAVIPGPDVFVPLG